MSSCKLQELPFDRLFLYLLAYRNLSWSGYSMRIVLDFPNCILYMMDLSDFASCYIFVVKVLGEYSYKINLFYATSVHAQW